MSWQEELKNNVTTIEELAKYIPFESSEIEKLESIVKDFPMSIPRYYPVSYTHLDVYKRQAYNQPVTKSFVEQVRGVDCSGVVNTLCQKGLLEEKGRLELPGRPLLYGTTTEFLRCFSFSSLEDLPPLPGDPSSEKTPIEESDAADSEEYALLPAQGGEMSI